MPLPSVTVAPMPPAWHQAPDLLQLDWQQIPPLPPLIRADGTGVAAQQTTVRPCGDNRALAVHFACEDRDIWGTARQRDDPLYEEEVVELFLAAGEETPIDYYEFEISPNGILFDAQIHNPAPASEAVAVDTSWDCPGVRWQAARFDDAHRWEAALLIPWSSLLPATIGATPKKWRGNFYRIERPRGDLPEFSCWSPTMTTPADFHRPAYFGTIFLP